MADPLTMQLLEWIASRPRTYAESMEAWRSSCPRLSIWDDALIDGLIQVERGAVGGQSRVTLTSRGRAMLAEASPSFDAGSHDGR